MIRRVLIACALALPAVPLTAQNGACPTNYAQVVSSKIGATATLGSGKLVVVAQGTDGNPINYSVPGAGVELLNPKVDSIVAGNLVSTLCLARSDRSSIPVTYHFIVHDTGPGANNKVVLDISGVPILSDTFSLDTYTYAQHNAGYINNTSYAGVAAAAQTPVGAIDSINTTFSVTGSPQAGLLYRNGLQQQPGIDYNLNTGNSTLTLTPAPQVGDVLVWVSINLNASVNGQPGSGSFASLAGSPYDNAQLNTALSNISAGKASFSMLSGAPTDNTLLASALNAKANSNAYMTVNGQTWQLGGTYTLAGGGGGSSTFAGLTDSPTNNAQLASALNAKISTNQIGASGGVAPLDSTGKVPSANLPASTGGGSTTFAGLTDSPTANAQLAAALNAKVSTSQIGAASGVAPLDSTGKVPSANLPAGTGGTAASVGNQNATQLAGPNNTFIAGLDQRELQSVPKPQLERWLDCLADAANEICNLVINGDSFEVANNVNSTLTIPPAAQAINILRAKLQAAYGSHGTGFIPLIPNDPAANLDQTFYSIVQGSVSYGDGSNGPSFGSFGSLVDMSPGSVIQFSNTIPYDTLHVYAVCNSASTTTAGQVDAYVDGSVVGHLCITSDPSVAGYSNNGYIARRLDGTSGTLGVHTATIACPGSPNSGQHCLVYAMQGTAGTHGVDVHNASTAGAPAEWVGTQPARQMAFQDLIPGGTQLEIVADLTNEPGQGVSTGTYATSLANIITHVQALSSPSPSIATMVPPECSISGTGPYVPVMLAAANTYSTYLINMRDRSGAYFAGTDLCGTGDSTKTGHPSVKEQGSMADQILAAITAAPLPAPAAATGSGNSSGTGFPVTIGNTQIAAGATVTTLDGVSVNPTTPRPVQASNLSVKGSVAGTLGSIENDNSGGIAGFSFNFLQNGNPATAAIFGYNVGYTGLPYTVGTNFFLGNGIGWCFSATIAGHCTLYIDTNGYQLQPLGAPSSSSASCNAGDWVDGADSYHYVCVAANTWRRVALSAF